MSNNSKVKFDTSHSKDSLRGSNPVPRNNLEICLDDIVKGIFRTLIYTESRSTQIGKTTVPEEIE